MEGRPLIASDVLSTYAADAAREVSGVLGLVEGGRHRGRGVRIAADEGALSVELQLAFDWGTSVPDVGRAVQARVADYLSRMADARPVSVGVTVAEIGPPPAH